MVPNLTSILTACVALAAVLALIWAAQRAARLGGLAPRSDAANRRLAVGEAIAIDQRRRLHLIRCDDRELLLMTGGAQDLVLGWLPPRS